MLRSERVSDVIEHIQLGQIVSSPLFDFRIRSSEEHDLVGLVESIRRNGLLQPVIVRKRKRNDLSDSEDFYELICGYRRYAACKRLSLRTIPCLVRDLDDRHAIEIALIENIQRESLDPIEEANALKNYVLNFGRGSISGLGEKIGKSEEYVSHRLLLLGLPKEIQDKISRRLLKPSQATELVWLKNTTNQIELGRKIIENNLSLRDTRLAIKILREKNLTAHEAVKRVMKDGVSLYSEFKNNESDSHAQRSFQELWSNQSEEHRANEEIVILNHAILVVRSCLAGLDILVGKKRSLYELLMTHRRKIHELLDELVQTKVVFRKEYPQN